MDERSDSGRAPIENSLELPGVIAGRYRVERELGRGGMGRVFLARDLRIDRPVAIKVLAREARDDVEIQSLEREARAVGALQQPNIVAVYDFGVVDDQPFLVLEYLQGRSLRTWLHERPRSLEEILDVAVQIVRGLAAAHAHRIVHRDLKPANVFVTDDGWVKILDFGIAKYVVESLPSPIDTISDNSAERDLIHTTIMGTYGYMAPEQLRREPADVRSDIFSFGALLYELLSGKAAFGGASAIERAYATLRQDPPPLPAHVPDQLRRSVVRCLQKDPARRFQSAEDLRFVLEGPLAGGRRNRSHRHRLYWIGGGLIVTSIAIALTVFGLRPGRRDVERSSFRQVTFLRGAVTSARFGAGGSIYYTEAWHGATPRIHSTMLQAPESHRLELEGAVLVASGADGRLAVLRRPRFDVLDFTGTLALVPPLGGAPREVSADVQYADFTMRGDKLAVVRTSQSRAVLEFPIGNPLYEREGRITHARISPAGDRIAFVDRPALGQDRAAIVLVDLAGKKTVLVAGWDEIDGLAWAARGRAALWFTGITNELGSNAALYEVDLAGQIRRLAQNAGDLKLEDVAQDGRVLVTQPLKQAGVAVRLEDQPQDRDLSWLDMPLLTDLTDDGRWVLFSSVGIASGDLPTVYLRSLDGAPAVRLGTGLGAALSPDGKWALSISVNAGPEKPMNLLPTTAGEARTLDAAGVTALRARFFPDGKTLLVAGQARGHGTQLFVRAIAGGAPRAISEEGVSSTYFAVSRDGARVAAVDRHSRIAILDLRGGSPDVLDTLPEGLVPVTWLEDGSLLVVRPMEVPAQILRVTLASRTAVPWRTIAPMTAGVSGISRLLVTPDGRTIAYNYIILRSNLFLLQGLH